MKNRGWGIGILLLLSFSGSLPEALAGAGKSPCDSLSRNGESPEFRAPLMERLKRQDPILGEDRYVEVVDSQGVTYQAKIAGYIKTGSTSKPKVLLPNGLGTTIDLEQIRSIQPSIASKNLWNQLESQVREGVEKKTLGMGDLKYLTLDEDEINGVYLVRVVAFQAYRGKVLPVVMFPEGEIKYLKPAELDRCFPSIESKKLWTGIETEQGILSVQKEISELPLSQKELIARAQGKNPIDPLPLHLAPPVQAEGLDSRVIDKKLSNGKVQRLGQSLQDRLKTRLLWIKNPPHDFVGFFLKDARFTDENGNFNPQARVIMASGMAISGRISDTEIHEIGHAKTHQSLIDGVPDPLAIEFEALPRKKLPRLKDYGFEHEKGFYEDFYSADESRQHAWNFYNAIHQRKTADVIEDFKNHPLLPVHQVFGVNLENFHDAVDIASDRLETVKFFNLRNQELARLALETLKSQSANPMGFLELKFDFYLKNGEDPTLLILDTPKSEVLIPVVGRAYDQIIAPLSFFQKKTELLDFSRRPESAKELSDYSIHYLENLIKMMETQALWIEKAEKVLGGLRLYSTEAISLESYRDALNIFIQVKSSVNLNPQKLGDLNWVSPASALR